MTVFESAVSTSQFPSYGGPESRFDAWENVSTLLTASLEPDVIRQATNTRTCGCPGDTNPTGCGC